MTLYKFTKLQLNDANTVLVNHLDHELFEIGGKARLHFLDALFEECEGFWKRQLSVPVAVHERVAEVSSVSMDGEGNGGH